MPAFNQFDIDDIRRKVWQECGDHIDVIWFDPEEIQRYMIWVDNVLLSWQPADIYFQMPVFGVRSEMRKIEEEKFARLDNAVRRIIEIVNSGADKPATTAD